MKKNFILTAALAVFFTNVNAQVGINTSSPSATLDILSNGNTASSKALEINNSSGAEMVTVLDNGNTGVGMTNPFYNLEVGDFVSNGAYFSLSQTGANANGQSAINFFSKRTGANGLPDATSKGWKWFALSDAYSATPALANSLFLENWNNGTRLQNVLAINPNGNVGFNIQNPLAKVDIVAAAAKGFRLNDGSQGVGKILVSDIDGFATWQTLAVSGAGSVTNFSAGDLSPLFTTTETTTDTTPALSFALTNAPANTIFGNNTGTTTAPTYFSTNTLALTGDVTGTLGATVVSKINGSPLGTTTGASSGSVLTFNGTNWSPATLPTPTNDWHITGNSDAEISTAAETLGATPASTNYLGTIGATDDLVLASGGNTRAVLDVTGTLKGGGTDGNSYFMWGSQNSATKASSTFTFNNAIIAGYKNTLTNSNIIPATGASATVILGKENSVNYNGVAIGYKNSVSNGLAFGSNNTASGIVIGTNNNYTSTGNILIGNYFTSTPYGPSAINGPNSSGSGTNIYASRYHFFQALDNAGAIEQSKIGVNVIPVATQESDIKVSKAIQIVATLDANMTCNATNEGAVRYILNAASTVGSFQGCRRSAASTFAWALLN